MYLFFSFGGLYKFNTLKYHLHVKLQKVGVFVIFILQIFTENNLI